MGAESHGEVLEGSSQSRVRVNQVVVVACMRDCYDAARWHVGSNHDIKRIDSVGPVVVVEERHRGIADGKSDRRKTVRPIRHAKQTGCQSPIPYRRRHGKPTRRIVWH